MVRKAPRCYGVRNTYGTTHAYYITYHKKENVCLVHAGYISDGQFPLLLPLYVSLNNLTWTYALEYQQISMRPAISSPGRQVSHHPYCFLYLSAPTELFLRNKVAPVSVKNNSVWLRDSDFCLDLVMMKTKISEVQFFVFSLEYWFSTRLILPPPHKGYLVMSGDIFYCPNGGGVIE